MIEGKFRKVLTTKSHYPNLMWCHLFNLDIIR
jgi:hypothetical protein